MRTATAESHFGNRAKIAKALNISRAAVSKWGYIVPEGSAYKLESITDGKLKVDAGLYLLSKTELRALERAAAREDRRSA